ncbi:hypothetical protein [Mesorhizobium sp.]|uniref:hypothetical protein n=1 Tax=Mesorhizobium sp. TaxID=1871066 RepID=UPI0025BB08A1|nr:hypothetical protein [Mesorhizobium sp.]
MPTLSIQGRKVQVDDAFLSMTPEQQNAAVDEIAKSLPGVATGRQPGGLSDAAKTGIAKAQELMTLPEEERRLPIRTPDSRPASLPSLRACLATTA